LFSLFHFDFLEGVFLSGVVRAQTFQLDKNPKIKKRNKQHKGPLIVALPNWAIESLPIAISSLSAVFRNRLDEPIGTLISRQGPTTVKSIERAG